MLGKCILQNIADIMILLSVNRNIGRAKMAIWVKGDTKLQNTFLSVIITCTCNWMNGIGTFMCKNSVLLCAYIRYTIIPIFIQTY